MGDTYNAQRAPLPQGVVMEYHGSKIETVRRGWGGVKWHVTSIPLAKIPIL